MITISFTIFSGSQIFVNIYGLEKLNAEFALILGHGSVINYFKKPTVSKHIHYCKWTYKTTFKISQFKILKNMHEISCSQLLISSSFILV